jgi:hypothetical protein
MLSKYYNKETKTLLLPCDFNEEIRDCTEEIEIIIFSEYLDNNNYSKFNQPVGNLPKTLTHLTFGFCFNKSADNLPQNLTHLTFGFCFNKPVDNLPKKLTHLTFDCDFNQQVDNLPETLTHLTFGFRFNQPVDNLPKNLIQLFFNTSYNQFGNCFNQPVDNLPNTLTHLTFGSSFNQSVDKLPETLTHLTFDNSFRHSAFNLPKNLIELKILNDNNDIIIPQKVKELYIYNENILINNLPECIEKLYILFYFGDKNSNKVENLPSIKEIIIEKKHYQKYIKIPFGTIITIKKIF